MLGYIISVSILFTVIGYGSALTCYTCSDLDSTMTPCSNSSSWPQAACDSGVNLCYYEADSARVANSIYNYSHVFRSCYDTSGGGPLDGWIPLMNQTMDCLTSRFTIESTKMEVGQSCQCICNSNGCNQPEFPCKNYTNQEVKTPFHIDQRMMLNRQERLLAIRKAVLKHSQF